MDFHKENIGKKSMEYLEEQPLSSKDRVFSKRYLENLCSNKDRIDQEIVKHPRVLDS